jgi:hypothetical protein
MRNSFQGLFFVLIVSIIFGCQHDGNNNNTPLSPTSPFITSFQPKGTISGLIFNAVTNVPVANALISVGFEGAVKTTTSSANGVFSFADVPAGSYKVVNGTSVLSGTYTLSVSLVNYNIAQTDPNKKYRDYYYSTVTITFTSLALGDSVPVGGMVGSVVMGISHLNTTLKGQIVDQDNQPVQNALVTLFDATVFPNVALGQIATGTTGEYQFNNIDNGLTVDITAKSSDGSLQGSLAGTFTLPANVMKDSLRTQVNAERIRITAVDNVAPFVISINPEHQSDIATSSKITVTFSEPIKQNAYTRTDLPLGSTTIIDDITLAFLGFKKANANISYTMLWQNNNTQLVITPQGLTGSSKYSFDMRTATNSGKLKDLANNVLANNTVITGDFELLLFSTNGNSPVPTVPTLTRRYISPLYQGLNFNGGTVGLQWNSDPNARSYNIYRSVNSGPFEILQKDYFETQFATATGSLVNPAGVNNPLSAIKISYLVRSVSKDLVESASSNLVTVDDEVKPQLLSATVVAGGGPNNWNYTLRFSEPLKIDQAEKIANYNFSVTTNVVFTPNKADYLGFSVNAYIVQLNVTTNAAPIPGYVLIVGNAVVDLNGLTIDPQANSRTF